jgi:hypothetical protein
VHPCTAVSVKLKLKLKVKLKVKLKLNVREGLVLFCPATQDVASKPRKADAKMQVRVKARIVVVHVEMATKHVEGTGT